MIIFFLMQFCELCPLYHILVAQHNYSGLDMLCCPWTRAGSKIGVFIL